MGKYYREHYSSVYRGIEQAHSIDPPRRSSLPLETLKNRLSHPKIVTSLLPRLKTVTLDEIHLHSGVQGVQVAMLMRRLRTLSSRQTKFIGASATIAKPEEHLSRLMGIDSTDLNLITPDANEMETDGVVHHSFIRPSGIVSQAGTLVNATSLMTHHRRDNLSERPGPEEASSLRRRCVLQTIWRFLGRGTTTLEKTSEQMSTKSEGNGGANILNPTTSLVGPETKEKFPMPRGFRNRSSEGLTRGRSRPRDGGGRPSPGVPRVARQKCVRPLQRRRAV